MARKRAAASDASPPFTFAPGAEIVRLALKPGEILVATIDREIARPDWIEALRDHIAAVLPPGAKLLILDDRVALSVAKPDAP